VLAIPALNLAYLVNHRASPGTIPTRVARPAAFQIFVFALLAHDSGMCSHPGVILSGATTLYRLFPESLPVSFILAQCAIYQSFKKQVANSTKSS